MWQRKQTVFLLLAVIVGMVYFMAWPLFVIQMLASADSLIAIFFYRDRPKQALLCLSAIMINLAWYVCLAVLIHNGMLSEELPLTACLPLVAAILCFLARKGVLADEKLVRSADRIR